MEDHAPSHEKCLPLSVFTKIAETNVCPLTEALGQLIITALFFDIRSCEYTTTNGPQKTKLIQLSDIHFFSKNKEINKITELHNTSPDKVTVTFVRQKNNLKDAIITMHRTGDALCPVLTLKKLITRILSYPNTNLASTINTVRCQNKNSRIKDKTVLQHIRNIVTIIGHDELGFGADEVGTHSVRSSFAMFLYLAKTRSDKIMMQGRWKSQAFLKYIRPQVCAFSEGLSVAMLQYGNFFIVPIPNAVVHEDHQMFNPEVEFLNEELYPR